MTEQQQEFGPWIEHDGKGCPCVGKMVEVNRANGDISRFIAGSGTLYTARASAHYCANKTGSWWQWVSDYPVYGEIIRYRIRKPRALLDLIQMVADLPAPAVKQPAPGVIA